MRTKVKKRPLKRTAKEAEKMIIAGLKEAVAIHRGKKKAVRERVHERAEPLGPPSRSTRNRWTRAARWARGQKRVVWAHVGTYPGDVYGIWPTKKRAEEAVERNPAFPGTIMRATMTIDK